MQRWPSIGALGQLLQAAAIAPHAAARCEPFAVVCLAAALLAVAVAVVHNCPLEDALVQKEEKSSDAKLLGSSSTSGWCNRYDSCSRVCMQLLTQVFCCFVATIHSINRRQAYHHPCSGMQMLRMRWSVRQPCVCTTYKQQACRP